jgi:hypothetical protein
MHAACRLPLTLRASQELQSYLSELGQWTQDVKRKDEALKGSVAAPTAVPVRGEPSGEPPAVPVPVRGEPSAAPPPRTPAAVASAAAASAGAASAPVADDRSASSHALAQWMRA